MPLITACPECHTQFIVKKEQLKAFEGQVRCGTCQHVFNAKPYLIKSTRAKKVTATQMDAVLNAISLNEDVPLDDAVTIVTVDSTVAELLTQEPTTETEIGPENLDVIAIDIGKPALDEVSLADKNVTNVAATDETHATPVLAKTQDTVTPADQADTQHGAADNSNTSSVLNGASAQAQFHQHLTKRPNLTKHTVSWPIFVLCTLLGLLLLSQLVYFMRTEISAHFPPTKPWLTAACAQLGCSVVLPKQIKYLTIDDSDMHEHLEYQEVLVFTSTLINHAPYAQAYPIIELTLTNTSDEPVLRRTLTAKDYLTSQVDLTQGIAANSDISIKLNLNTADIAVSGYRVALNY